MSGQRLIGRFGVDLPAGSFLGDTRIRLLEAIERTGSISQAAREVPLSYKAAWDAVDAMNNLADQPLVERVVGGRHGGGTALTPYGRQLMAAFRALAAEYQRAVDQVAETLAAPGEADADGLRRMLRSVGVMTSARNQFQGPVTSLRAGEVTFEVGVRVDGHNEVVAHISREGAEQMRLGIGRMLHAWVNAASVLLVTDERVRLSARNRLWGEVARIHVGPVAAEVTLVLPAGRTVCALITRDALDMLELQEGVRACAVFKASSVMLAAFD